jgi:hypothetical protein
VIERDGNGNSSWAIPSLEIEIEKFSPHRDVNGEKFFPMGKKG